MEWLALSILILSCLIGFVAVFVTTVGTLIILCGAVAYAWMTGFAALPLGGLVILLVLYLVGEVLEYVLAFVGARRLGASKAAAMGALVGGFLGAVAGAPVVGVGVFVGMLLGVFLGAFLVELVRGGDARRSLRAGAAGLAGRGLAIAAKSVIALAMFGVIGFHLLRAG